MQDTLTTKHNKDVKSSVKSSRTMVRRTSSKAPEVLPPREGTSQTYNLPLAKFSYGFSNSLIDVKQEDYSLKIQLPYPEDVSDLKRELEQLRLECHQQRKQLDIQKDRSQELIYEQVEIVLYDVEIQTDTIMQKQPQTELVTLECQKTDVSEISAKQSPPLQKEKGQLPLDVEVYLKEIQLLKKEINILTKEDKNLRSQVISSQQIISRLTHSEGRLREQVTKKDRAIQQLSKEVKLFHEKLGVQKRETQIAEERNREIKKVNKELIERNNHLVEEVIHLESRLMGLNQEFQLIQQSLKEAEERNQKLAKEEVKEIKWSESEDDLRRTIHQLRQDLNQNHSDTKGFKKEIFRLVEKLKQMKQVIKDVKTKNKSLRKEKHVEVEDHTDEGEQFEVIEEEIVEYDVEIQTDLMFSDLESLDRRAEGERQQGDSQPLLVKELRAKVHDIEKHLEHKNSRIDELNKRVIDHEKKIRNQKKIIHAIKNEKKELARIAGKVEQSDHIEIQEVLLVEYDVEIQTQITLFSNSTSNPFMLLDKEAQPPTLFTPPQINVNLSSIPVEKVIQIPIFVDQEILLIRQVLVPSQPPPPAVTQPPKVIERVVQKIVEKPVEIIVERVVEKVVEKPVERIVYTQKIVEKPVIQYLDREVIKYIEAPQTFSGVQQIATLSCSNESLQHQNSKMKTEILDLKDLCDKLYNDNLALIGLGDQSKQLNDIINNNNVQIAELKETIQNLGYQLSSLQTSTSTQGTTNASLKSYDSMMSRYSNEIDNHKKANKELQLIIKRLGEQKATEAQIAGNEISRLNQAMTVMSCNVSEMGMEVEKLRSKQSDVGALIGHNHELQANIETLEKQLTTKESVIFEHHKNANSLATELKAVREEYDLYREQESLRARYDQENFSKALEEEEYTFNSEIALMSEQLNVKTSESQELRKRLSDQKKEVDDMVQLIRNLKESSLGVHRELADKEKDNQTIMQQVMQMQKEFERSQKHLERSQKELSQASELIMSINREKEEYVTELTTLRANSLQQKASSVTAWSQKYHTLETQFSQALQQIANLTNSVENEHLLVTNLTEENHALQFQVSTRSDSKQRPASTVNSLPQDELLSMSQDLKSSQEVIRSLKMVIHEYQLLLDEQNKEQLRNEQELPEEKVDQESLKLRIQEYERLINGKIENIDDFTETNREIAGIRTGLQGLIERLIRKLQKEKERRVLLENRITKVGHSLVAYEQEIMEKSQRINYLNTKLLDLQEKSSVTITREDKLLNSEFHQKEGVSSRPNPASSVSEYYEQQNQLSSAVKPRTHFPHQSSHEQKHVQKNKSDDNRDRRHMDTSYKLPAFDREYENPERVVAKEIMNSSQYYPSNMLGTHTTTSLKTLIDEKKGLSPKAITALFLKTVEEVEAHSQKTLHLCPSSILVSDFDNLHPESIRLIISACSTRRSSKSLYESPELILRSQYSPSSVIWTLGVIFDQLINKSVFFQKMSQLVDSQYEYEFRLGGDKNLQGLKRILKKMLIKDKAQRMNLANLLISLRLENQRANKARDE